MEKTSLLKQLSQLCVVVAIVITLYSVLTKQVVTCHFAFPFGVDFNLSPHVLWIIVGMQLLLYLLITKIRMTSYRINSKRFEIVQTEENMQLMHQFRERLLLTVNLVLLYMVLSFAGMVPFTIFLPNLLLAIIGIMLVKLLYTIWKIVKIHSHTSPFYVILQRGLEPVAHFCVTLQSQIGLVCPQTTAVGSAGRMRIYNINRYTNNKIMAYLFSSESVSEGHPDKVSDQISDALVDQFLAYDDEAHCAIETFVTTGQVVIMGEVRSDSYIDLQTIARNTINRIGYTKSEYQFDGNSCGVLTAIHEQSDDINRGVSREEAEEQGAGDQGMMFGYATNETENYMPLSLDLAHLLMITLAEIRKEGKEMTYLRPDSKSQVTVEYSDDGQPVRIDTIVVSTQHDDFGPDDDQMLAKIKADVLNVLMPRVKAQITSPKVLALFNDDIKYFVNPTGKFVIGGPHGDTGLTGRKIIVDTYGGKGAHGGGAFSGKDPSKVDRSAAYAARHIAKNMVAAGVADEMQVQVSYAIGVAKPVNIYVNTYGRSKVKFTDGEIAQKVAELFDLRPKAIERTLKLRQPIYTETAAYGHMGRKNEVVKKTFTSRYHETKVMEVELFTWEKLDRVDDIKKAFGL